MIDLPKLAALAQAATPGPWDSPSIDDDCVTTADNGRYIVEDPDCPPQPENVRFIAACSPDVILSLINRLTRAEADRARIQEAARRLVHYRKHGHRTESDHWDEAWKALEAALSHDAHAAGER